MKRLLTLFFTILTIAVFSQQAYRTIKVNSNTQVILTTLAYGDKIDDIGGDTLWRITGYEVGGQRLLDISNKEPLIWGLAGSGGGSLWTSSGGNIYFSTGNVGIGKTSPTETLDVGGNALIQDTLFTKSPIADIRAFGASTFSADNTEAIQAAFNASTNIYIPAGIYVTDTIIVTNDETHIYGDGIGSVLELKTGATGSLLYCGGNTVVIEDIKLDGGTSIDYRTNTYTGNDRTGISIDAATNSVIKNVMIDGFEFAAIYPNNLERGVDVFLIDGCVIEHNYYGIMTANINDTSQSGEYMRMIGNSITYNRYGVYINCGNTTLVGGSIWLNYYGVYINGDVLNNAHGTVTGCLINHNNYNIYANNVEHGHMFTGNMVYDGVIELDSCIGIQFADNTISVDTINLIANDVSYFRHNYMPVSPSFTNIINRTNGDNTKFIDNIDEDNELVSGRNLDNLYLYDSASSLEIKMTDIDTDENYLDITPTSSIFYMPTYFRGKSTFYSQSVNNDFQRWYATDGNILGGIWESSNTDGLIYLRDSSNTNTVCLNSRGTSYFKGGNVGIGKSSPTDPLTVVGDIVVRTTGDTYSVVRMDANSAAGALELYRLSALRVKLNSNGDSYITFNSPTTEGFGIGTSSPNTTLDVDGTTTTTMLNLTPTTAPASPSNGDVYLSSSDDKIHAYIDGAWYSLDMTAD